MPYQNLLEEAGHVAPCQECDQYEARRIHGHYVTVLWTSDTRTHCHAYHPEDLPAIVAGPLKERVERSKRKKEAV